MTSTGVPRTPDGNAVAERPSFVARAPVAPEEKKTYVKGAPRSSCPATWMPQMLAEPSAITRAGSALPRAPAMTCGRKWPTTCLAATAAGRLTLRIEPSGAVMRSGRNAPSLFGTSGLTMTFTPRSEEHTSELQSLRHLVCRLLLE